MAKRKNLPTDNTVPVPPTPLEEQLEGYQPWHDIAADKELEFFDLLRALPAGAWDELMIYLYRLEPQIAVRAGEKKYIERYTGPIDEDTIKKQFGGGKYLAYLKADTITIREHKFSIDGPAIIQEGQTVTGKAPAGVLGPGVAIVNDQSALERIVGEVIRATKGDPAAANAGIEIMKKGMIDTLDIMKAQRMSEAGSATGNPIADKLLDRAIAKLDEKPATGSSLSESLAVIREVAKILRPEGSTKENPSVTDQFSIVKELLGVESLKEVFEMARPDAKSTPWYVTLITSAIEKLPTIMTEFSRMQQEGFQRALTAHQLVGAVPGQIPRTPVINAAAPPPSPPAAVPAGEIPGQMIQAIIDAICNAYDEGYDGEFAAAHLKLSYPRVVETLKPMLANTAQLSAFVATVPALAERATEPEWAQFQAEFIQELTTEPMPATAPPTVVIPAPAPAIFPNAADVAGETARRPPKKAAPAPKKKVNGSGAA